MVLNPGSSSNRYTSLNSRSALLFAPMSLERDAEIMDQSRSGEGFGEETNCSRLQRSGASAFVREGRDEYERRAITLGAHQGEEL